MTQESAISIIQEYLQQGITDFSKILAEIGEEPPMFDFYDEIEVALYITHKKSYEVYRVLRTANRRLYLTEQAFSDLVGWSSENKRARNKVRAVIRAHINAQLKIWRPDEFFVTTSVAKSFKGLLLKRGTTSEVHQQMVNLGETAPAFIDQALAYNVTPIC